MFFTQEDYIKIQQWLSRNSVKDTEFNEANIPFNGNEIVSIVQGNQNKRVFLKDLVSQIFNLGVSDFVNITDKYDAPNISLEEAIRFIPSRARKEGQVITFLDREDHWHIYQFKGALNQWNILDTWEDLFDWEKLIIDSILPDEEDLTKSSADEKGNSYLSLKDREYNPKDFSGLGRVILRKNIMEVEDPIYGKVKKNILYQDMINKSNTIYEIRYDFDLNGVEITIPEGCILQFEGGSLSNGVIVGNNTTINAFSVKIFNIDITLLGTYLNIEFNANWFGLHCGNVSDEIFRYVCKLGKTILFDNGRYDINLESSINLHPGTVLKGASILSTASRKVTKNKTQLVLSLSNGNYYIGLCRYTGITDMYIQATESQKELDIVRIDTTFIENPIKVGDSNVDYGFKLQNLYIEGAWNEANHYPLTGIAILCRNKDDNGKQSDKLPVLTESQTIKNIKIGYVQNGIFIKVIENDFDIKYGKVWCNSLLFEDIYIMAVYGFRTYFEGLRGDSGYFRINNYMFQGQANDMLENSTSDCLGLYGPMKWTQVSNYQYWDVTYAGEVSGFICVSNWNGWITKTEAGYGLKSYNGNKPEIVDNSWHRLKSIQFQGEDFDYNLGGNCPTIKVDGNQTLSIVSDNLLDANRDKFKKTFAFDYNNQKYIESIYTGKIPNFKVRTQRYDINNTDGRGVYEDWIYDAHKKKDYALFMRWYPPFLMWDNPPYTDTTFLPFNNVLLSTRKLNINLPANSVVDLIVTYQEYMNKKPINEYLQFANVFNLDGSDCDMEIINTFYKRDNAENKSYLKIRLRIGAVDIISIGISALIKVYKEGDYSSYETVINEDNNYRRQTVISHSVLFYYKGETSQKPSPSTLVKKGFQYFDTTLNKPVWWTGTKWVDATGADV